MRNSIFRNNAVTGIGGDSLAGGLIEGNIIHGNGAQGAGGAAANGGGIKLTQAGTVDRPVVVHEQRAVREQEDRHLVRPGLQAAWR